MKFGKKLNFEFDGNVYDYKLFDTLKAIKENSSQRRAAKELGISHAVLNRRIITAEEKFSKELVRVSNRGSFLTGFAKTLLDEYESYERRLVDDDVWTVAGGFVSCEFIKQLSMAYQLDNIRFLQCDMDTAFEYANMGLVDILAFDDPVQAYIFDLEPIPLARDSLMLLSGEPTFFSTLTDLNGLDFVEVDGSSQRLAWTTLANNDLDFDIVKTVKSFNEAIKLVEENENLYTFINKSMAYRCQNVNDVISEHTRHIISALNVKNSVDVESFLNFASHKAQKLTLSYGFEQL